MDDYEARLLVERAKELECMYAVDEVLQNKKLTLPSAMRELVHTIPIGFSCPVACRVKITMSGAVYCAPDFSKAQVLHNSPIALGSEHIGDVSVGYIKEFLEEDCELLSNEIKLLDAICRRISLLTLSTQRELNLLLDMLSNIDPDMLLRIGEKLRVHLKNTSYNNNAAENMDFPIQHTYGEVNSPLEKRGISDSLALARKLITDAAALLPQEDIYGLMSGWIQEQRIFALVKTIDGKDSKISDILDAVRKYNDAVSGNPPDKSLTETWLISELAHRFLTNDEYLISLVLDNLHICDFIPMIERIIGSDTSMGNIGGKGAGLFIAKQILDHASKEDVLLQNIKTPRTWYVAADHIVDFLHYNNLTDLNSYKYNSTFYLRMTYDNIVDKIKNSKLPPHTMQMLSIVLDDLEDCPLIVRSSSLLEDRQSGAFSGKYKSLFLPNTGTKQQRLEALADAILEVYSSMYNPDSISYRRERGLLNFTEQMGVLIQEVVGKKMGKYFMPAFAGVAFSQNILRWSSRIKREGGLVRMVMGLGTRAVDRVNDDYPILFSPAQPGLQINQTPSDIRHYSPKHIDLINLKEGKFETVSAASFLKEMGTHIPGLSKYVSVYNNDFIEQKNAISLDPQHDEMLVTFNHILTSTDIPKKIKRMLDVLADRLECPVDIEFAYDGEQLYLLQCRPQGQGMNAGPAPIPKNLNPKDVLFTANKFISDGLIEDISYIVYVDPEAYGEISTLEEMLAVGTAVGQLNDALPRRKYILMGPGRWGSRGDIKLGVRVTYSDISGTAALIEIAKEQRSYVPELSFGTHFFQDLVEADIAYIPLYPDQSDVVFKESFFKSCNNILGTVLPKYAWLSHVIKVIDVPGACLSRTLYIHMNADLEQSVAFLKNPQPISNNNHANKKLNKITWEIQDQGEHWQWRHYMAGQISDTLDMEAMGVNGIYLFGSTNAGNPGMGSDIDLLLLVDQDKQKRKLLETWLDGWSRALAKINFLHTGYNVDKLLDIHIVTEEDIKNGDPFAIKIISPTDPATPMRVKD